MSITDPVQLFHTIVDRMNAEDWSGVAGLCDPVSLIAFRRTTLEQLSPRNQVTMSVDDYMRTSKDMPREVAEYHVKERQERLNGDGRLRKQFPGVDSLAALSALEPPAFFAQWLSGKSAKHDIRAQVERGELSHEIAATLMSQPIPRYFFESIGSLRDGERVAHVMYRPRMAAMDAPEAQPWLANITEEERELARDLFARDHPMIFLCLRQPDEGWLGVAEDGFLWTGSMSFHVEVEAPTFDIQFGGPFEASP